MTPRRIAIVVLGNGALDTAKKIRALYPGSAVFGLRGRVDDADVFYDDFGATLCDLYRDGMTIVALCAAGIVIRTLATAITDSDADKTAEPPVLAVAADGSAVVPLLGGLSGVNVMAREMAALLQTVPAITTSGELRFGTCLLHPPAGYALADIEAGKHFVADLLAGATVRVEGDAPWLHTIDLPRDVSARHIVRISTCADAAAPHELRIYPRSVIAMVDAGTQNVAAALRTALSEAGIAAPALACLVAEKSAMADGECARAASDFDVPLRFVEATALPGARCYQAEGITLYQAERPVDPTTIGQARGTLTVIGLGPGAASMLLPVAKSALEQATDILGYATYVEMAGPFRPEQTLHNTDNREEMQRARHAFALAAGGRRVAVVSSGDPGVFAMAAAVLEALHESQNPDWHAVDLQIYPGVSAAFATAAQAGAPLGHDFCVLSLSDNLKPWPVIENRLESAVSADFALAFYNPISRARPWQLGRALEIVRRHRSGDTVVVLGRDIGRPGAALTTLTLAALHPDMVDMRTLVIIGSSLTQRFARAGNAQSDWVYTPRWYPSR